jgi:hypothetical protein
MDIVGIIGIVLAVFGVILAVYFGIRSILQSQEMETMKRALRATNQAAFNNLWRMGALVDDLLKSDDLHVAKQFASDINGMSQSGRHWIISTSKEQVLFRPFFEPAWEPEPLAPQKPKSFWRNVFFPTRVAHTFTPAAGLHARRREKS